MFNHLRKAVVAALVAGALMLAGGAAHATTAPDSIVDTKKTGNIHLVKYDNAENAVADAKDRGTRDQKIPDGSNRINGIEFTLTPITKAPGIDDVKAAMGSNAAIKALGDLNAGDVVKARNGKAEGWAFGETKVEKTAEGAINWTGLDLGVYLLEETDSTGSDGKVYTAAAPSLIYLPTTNPKDQSSWIWEDEEKSAYAVWVYPKNSVNENKKTVKDANKQVGDTIEYTISASVPAVQELDKALEENKGVGRTYNLKDFALYDNLDEKLALDNTDSVKVYYGTNEDDPTKNEELASEGFTATLYKGDGTNSLAGETEKGQKLVVALTDKGLDLVAAAKKKAAGTKVFLVFTPTVKAAGITPNQAVVYKNTGDGKGTVDPQNPGENPPDKGQDTNIVVSGWGKIEITKTDGKSPILGTEEAKKAEFKVFGVTGGVYGKDEGAVIDYGENNDKAIKVLDPKTNKMIDTFKTDEEGKLSIEGLHANNLADFKDVDPNAKSPYTSYVLVETKAPDTYELNHAPIPFVINIKQVDAVKTESSWTKDENGNVTVDPDKKDQLKITLADLGKTTAEDSLNKQGDLVVTTDVVNIPVKPKLPMTGGAGVALFGFLGLAIIGGGVYAAKRNTKKA
ncbi:SpaH/EbpB family LPXTG-anchored major pilin [Trueperella pyogenes]|uniref:SpaH/EbpB family LPXTG-anchored major pilin n=1 Tax=Trueperella pyogenes TaxID=1661 RepID=UPI00345D7DDF